ncbi:hypothetical protein LWI29_001650 [Acer saccharum]|uniref:Uncharacterized protein n=1 Tax=Acer saccharum TaxID=4024 RepID=A0AA39RNR1_ACESA|nr:hypothetical protein LWI29_001650 [Acer saccharum]
MKIKSRESNGFYAGESNRSIPLAEPELLPIPSAAPELPPIPVPELLPIPPVAPELPPIPAPELLSIPPATLELPQVNLDLGLVEVCPLAGDPIQGITGSSNKGGALVSNNKEVEISSGEVGGSANACVSSDSRGIREDMVKATVAAERDHVERQRNLFGSEPIRCDVQFEGSKPIDGRGMQSGSEEEDLFCSIDSAGTKDQMEKNVDVERAKMDDWVPTTIEKEKEVAATRLSKKKAVDSVEEDASTVITQVQVGLSVEELSTYTICHEQVSRKRGRREVEDEVTKTLEIGTALGFDFIGVEDEVMEAIVRREENDAIDFEALNGH